MPSLSKKNKSTGSQQNSILNYVTKDKQKSTSSNPPEAKVRYTTGPVNKYAILVVFLGAELLYNSLCNSVIL